MIAFHFLLIAALSVTLVFAALGAFFLCFVRLQRKTTAKVLTPVERMTYDLSSQAAQLEEPRLCMFLDWLQCHCYSIPVQWAKQDGDEIQNYLNRWMGTFTPDGLHAEYRLIMTEIRWWKNADEKTLMRCMSKRVMEMYT
jgi:hypothetical protein